MVLQVVDLCRRRPARGIDRRRAHRHPPIRKDDSQIHPEPKHDQPRARQSPVDQRERHKEAVGRRERRYRESVVARRGRRLEQEPNERCPPPVHANAFERTETSTCDKSRQQGEDDEGHDDGHGRSISETTGWGCSHTHRPVSIGFPTAVDGRCPAPG
jgi:hypothetical protein